MGIGRLNEDLFFLIMSIIDSVEVEKKLFPVS